MAVAKLSVSFDPELAETVKQAAEDENETVSAWLAEAARQRVRNLLLGKVIAEMMEQHGWTEADLEAAAKEARSRAITYDPETGTWHPAEV